MFSIFTKKQPNVDLSWLAVDIHSHILPALDDGAPDMQASLSFLKFMESIGFQKLIFTPHISSEFYPNTPTIIANAFWGLQTELQAQPCGMELSYAAEYLLDCEFLALMESGTMLCLKDQYLLLEFSFIAELKNAVAFIERVKDRGYIPVLAHPERYRYYARNIDIYKQLHKAGCLFQCNILSFTGYYGRTALQTAQELIKYKLVDLLGSDLHHKKHQDTLFAYLQSGKFYKQLASVGIKNRELFL